jgi:hypothetical protein
MIMNNTGKELVLWPIFALIVFALLVAGCTGTKAPTASPEAPSVTTPAVNATNENTSPEAPPVAAPPASPEPVTNEPTMQVQPEDTTSPQNLTEASEAKEKEQIPEDDCSKLQIKQHVLEIDNGGCRTNLMDYQDNYFVKGSVIEQAEANGWKFYGLSYGTRDYDQCLPLVCSKGIHVGQNVNYLYCYASPTDSTIEKTSISSDGVIQGTTQYSLLWIYVPADSGYRLGAIKLNQLDSRYYYIWEIPYTELHTYCTKTYE